MGCFKIQDDFFKDAWTFQHLQPMDFSMAFFFFSVGTHWKSLPQSDIPELSEGATKLVNARNAITGARNFACRHQMRQHRGTLWICFLVFFLVPRIAVFSQLFGDGIWLVEDASQTWHLATFMWSAMSFDTRWFTPYLQKRSKTRSSISWLRILREACGAQQLKHFALN